ncbi:MAG: hypothetical protein LBR54_03885, partial [Oscillospiraceae bacterium]|nr:hypothetical protein [Oscillospiraceae bacterium]
MYKEITLEKGMYNLTGKTFTQALEEIDPTENYAGTPLSQLDAYERQLKRFDIKTFGEDCDTVEKFFESTQSAVLFPEFVKRAIKQGFEGSPLEKITAVTTHSEDDAIHGINMGYVPTATLTGTAPGGVLPPQNVTRGAVYELKKIGKILNMPYEVVRKGRLDFLAVGLKAFGRSISAALLNQAVEELSKLTSTYTSGVRDAFIFEDIMDIYASFSEFDMTTIIANPSTVARFLMLDEFKETASLNLDGTVLPCGIEFVKCAAMDPGKFIAIDKNFALEFVTAGDILIELDKDISKQFENLSVSVQFAFT